MKPSQEARKTSTASSRQERQASGAGPLDRVSADLLRKIPPQNLEAEQAVLGGIFLNNTIFHTLADLLTEDDFYSPAHRHIYATFLDLYRRNVPIDLVTASDDLKRTGRIEEVGGASYLAQLTESVASASNAVHHAHIVREKSIRRNLIQTAANIIASSYEAGEGVDALLDEAEQKIFAISEAQTKPAFRTSKELVATVFEHLERRVERKELVTGVPTDYKKFDELTAGLQPTDLIILAARPSMGKTALALNMAMRAAVRHEVPTAIFSLEMSQEQLMMRMLCAWGKVDLSRLRSGYLNDEDWTRLYQAADVLSVAPIYIDDTAALSTLELRARCRRLKAEKGLGLVVVDYLQLMRTHRYIDSREQEISDISRTLKAIAKEMKVPVLALSQLNRKVEERTNKRPGLADLRESGAIEQDADVIVFIYRDEVYNRREDNPKRGLAEIIIGKQRNGPTGDLELAYLGKYTAFEDLAASGVPSESSGF